MQEMSNKTAGLFALRPVDYRSIAGLAAADDTLAEVLDYYWVFKAYV